MLKLLQDVDDEPAEEPTMASRATVAIQVWLRMVCRRFATLALADLTKARLEAHESHLRLVSLSTRLTCHHQML